MLKAQLIYFNVTKSSAQIEFLLINNDDRGELKKYHVSMLFTYKNTTSLLGLENISG